MSFCCVLDVQSGDGQAETGEHSWDQQDWTESHDRFL